MPQSRLWGILAGTVAVILPVVLPGYLQYDFCLTAINILVIAGMNVLIGWSGQISLGQAGFAAIGAYTSAILAHRLGLGILPGVVAATILAGAMGVVMAVLVLRLEGPYLAVATLAFGAAVSEVATDWTPFTNGPAGLQVPAGHLLWLNFANYVTFAYVLIVLVAAVFALLARLSRSKVGRGMMAVKNDELVSRSYGLNVTYYRVVAFALSAALAGLAGGLQAYLTRYVSPDEFGLWNSVFFLAGTVVGGAGWLYGPVLGGILITAIPVVTANLQSLPSIVLGTVLFLALAFFPRGLVRSRGLRHPAPSPGPPRAGEEGLGGGPPA